MGLVAQLGGATRAVIIQRPYVYLGVGPRLVVLDLSDPVVPTLLGQSPPLAGVVAGIALAGSYAYVATSSDGSNPGSLHLLSLNDLAHPEPISDLTVPAAGVALLGVHVLLPGWDGHLRIVNVADPTSPFQVGECSLPSGGLAVVAGDRYAYVTVGAPGAYHGSHHNPGMCIVDVADPTHPTLLSYTETIASGVALVDQYAYVAGNPLRVYDVSDPTSPREIGDLPGDSWGIVIDGSRAYAAGPRGFSVLDVTNPRKPSLSGGCTTWAHAVAADYPYAIVAQADGGLDILDVTSPAEPVQAGSYPTLGSTWDLALAGTRAYVTTDLGGLRVVDVAEPTRPTLVGSIFTLVGSTTPIRRDRSMFGNSWLGCSGQHAYVFGVDGLHVIDIADPSMPAEMAHLDIHRALGAAGAVVHGHNAYIPTSDPNGVRIVDLSDPREPKTAGFYRPADLPSTIAALDDQLYIGTYSNGLEIVDVTDPANPKKLSTHVASHRISHVTVTGDYAYVVSDEGMLRIVEVQNPANPRDVGYFYGRLWRTAVDGRYAYGLRSSRVTAIDVSDPSAPREIGSYQLPLAGAAIAARDIHCYVTTRWGGLYTLEVLDVEPGEIGGST